MSWWIWFWNSVATRLVNGTNNYSGRVEVFNGNYHPYYGKYQVFAKQFGTVCDNEWTESDANVVCRSLGYRATGATPHVGGSFGAGDGPIWAKNVICSGDELHTLECHNLNRNCDHATDVGVTCLGKDHWYMYCV